MSIVVLSGDKTLDSAEVFGLFFVRSLDNGPPVKPTTVKGFRRFTSESLGEAGKRLPA